ncbi:MULTISPECIES: NAD(P)H-dependent flavin oxidoreductase [unclassified Delftia]|uniref:NAD(P)H-dependent flavin oxidoreductase n=1 Tax=unclassified Delftia TaxID=2613839 RepID=UPI001902198A|nr:MULTISPECIES: nitronate monooxygenase [unclassified Delftia]MBK0114044.1 nitronate monooxygenase [Delftia sp. S65]MBK0117852.1 nitronate monooxygenase [Delftia sp. S67]MBK0129149.1 nitronate monooxygenase [Delftia sp. S66]
MSALPSPRTGLPGPWAQRLRLPLIAAPMFQVSGPQLVIAACRAGVIGAFPTANCRTAEELNDWLTAIEAALEPQAAPYCPNLIIRHAAMPAQLEVLLRHRVELVITSVGSPAPVIEPLHAIGCKVFADVASLRHARRALEAGADGLVLLSAGAGGQTGWANGFAFVRAVRRFYAGPIVLAGGLSDGQALWAARALGCDLGYMGTRFIATAESLAPPEYQQMLVDSEFDDVLLSSAFTGLPSNMLRPSVAAAGLDPDALPTDLGAEGARRLFGAGGSAARRWSQIWSAGHSVSGVTAIGSVAELIDQTAREYQAAREFSRSSD